MNKKLIGYIGVLFLLMCVGSSNALIDLTGSYQAGGGDNIFNQNLNTTDTPTFDSLKIVNKIINSNDNNIYIEFGVDYFLFNVGDAALLSFTQDEFTVTAIIDASAINTGYGDNEVYPMDQSVKTTADVTFNRVGVNTATPDQVLDVNGNTNITGTLNVTNNITGNVHYASAWYHNHDGATLTFVSDVWYNLTFNASDCLNGFTWDGDGNLTCLVPGLYSVGFIACGSGQNNHVYHLGVAVNGVVQEPLTAHKKMAAGGDITDMGGSGFVRLSASDYVSLMIRDHGGSGTGLYVHSNLNLVRIGD